MYQFSPTSLLRLATCHEDLQLIFKVSILTSRIDFGIAEGHRSIGKQLEYFRAGKSKIDGVEKKGKHNYTPSMAVDIYAYYNGSAKWDKESLCYLAGHIIAVADQLFGEGQVGFKIRWGGNWSNDGVIVHDQTFDDLPHFELV
tara:strand:- start:2042 stop:2470 length:429 start_codon:yes stop_codon:yes gene_type:complete